MVEKRLWVSALVSRPRVGGIWTGWGPSISVQNSWADLSRWSGQRRTERSMFARVEILFSKWAWMSSGWRH